MNTFEDQGNSSHSFAERVASTQSKLTQDLPSEYDYIICGAGTSGSVLAYRLCEDPSVRVLLLEAGGSDESETIEDPNRWVMTLGSDSDWGFAAAPNPRLNGRAVSYSMGKILGGGSSINVSTWSRGHKADWDFLPAKRATQVGATILPFPSIAIASKTGPEPLTCCEVRAGWYTSSLRPIRIPSPMPYSPVLNPSDCRASRIKTAS